jgi:hypothetical protein
MEKEKLILLKGEIQGQSRGIEKIYAKIEERKTRRDIVNLESLAYQLHNLYCAFEDLFRIVADNFENYIEERRKYHRELLWRMSISIEGVRPALLSNESLKLLDSLRAFRHFFRHAYAYELDPKKVNIVLEDAFKLKRLYKKETKKFLQNLGI